MLFSNSKEKLLTFDFNCSDHFSQFSIKREDVDEIDQLENEDEIDQLEEDDIVPGIYQDLTSLFRNSTIPVVESSPTLECSTPNLLLESRIKGEYTCYPSLPPILH